ncbi:hypothetical protein CRG98_040391 [Punica granatum]|uniref:Uncharacterized protein n=1 Tax=Punica granatum TaxID=22663 RepID=A0A2I0I5G6_PUNGR|nr:hypothetical protein CRG98_040391 [Punica granatum]
MKMKMKRLLKTCLALVAEDENKEIGDTRNSLCTSSRLRILPLVQGQCLQELPEDPPLLSEDYSTHSIEKSRDEPLEEIEALKHKHRRELHLHGAKELVEDNMTFAFPWGSVNPRRRTERVITPKALRWLQGDSNPRIISSTSCLDEAKFFIFDLKPAMLIALTRSISWTRLIFSLTRMGEASRFRSVVLSVGAEAWNVTEASAKYCID